MHRKNLLARHHLIVSSFSLLFHIFSVHLHKRRPQQENDLLFSKTYGIWNYASVRMWTESAELGHLAGHNYHDLGEAKAILQNSLAKHRL